MGGAVQEEYQRQLTGISQLALWILTTAVKDYASRPRRNS